VREFLSARRHGTLVVLSDAKGMAGSGSARTARLESASGVSRRVRR
jgi:hypothetical protein